MLSLSKLIAALSENGIVHVGLQPPETPSGWWLQLNLDDLDDPANSANLLQWEAEQ